MCHGGKKDHYVSHCWIRKHVLFLSSSRYSSKCLDIIGSIVVVARGVVCVVVDEVGNFVGVVGCIVFFSSNSGWCIIGGVDIVSCSRCTHIRGRFEVGEVGSVLIVVGSVKGVVGYFLSGC